MLETNEADENTQEPEISVVDEDIDFSLEKRKKKKKKPKEETVSIFAK